MKIKIGTRGSKLALIQTDIVINKLAKFTDAQFEVVPIKTQGDIITRTPMHKIGEGAFEKEVDNALIDGTIDLAVHSMKDVPLNISPSIKLGAIPDRESPNDVFISARYPSLAALPAHAKLATSSVRRKAQLMAVKKDLQILPLRGNVDTRLKKVMGESCDGAVLAEAGLLRLGLLPKTVERLSIESFPTSPGQAAICVLVRNSSSDQYLTDLVASINSPAYQAEVLAEREFLRTLGGGCASPVGCTATAKDGRLRITAGVYSVDGAKFKVESIDMGFGDPVLSGRRAAQLMLEDEIVKTFWRLN